MASSTDLTNSVDRVSRLRNILLDWRNKIETRIYSSRKHILSAGTREPGANDLADVAKANSEQDLSVSNLERDREWLKRVNVSIESLDKGTYGFCFDCGEEIAENRLEAIPFAMRCKGCQESYENMPKTKTFVSFPTH